ncbi:MAG: MBL fold metallo-hydrolase [Oscillospiraceae bacterium]|nr:MBL fold metallo-hydrolase [Oscillospiraceae bacterium]
MKITKYPQSCLLVETKDKKILIDPGALEYKEEYFDVWNSVDAILITHKHGDHCHTEVLQKLNKDIQIYSTSEVQRANEILDISIVKENDTIELDNIKVEVVRAVHGYQPWLKGELEIHENVGFIIDDGNHRLYATSDSICFKNEYKADILCTPVTGYGLTMSAFEAALYSKEVGATLTLIIHMDNPTFPPHPEFINEMFTKHEVEHEILEIGESLEIE